MKTITEEMIDKMVDGYLRLMQTEMSITNLKSVMKNPRVMSKYKEITKKLIDKGVSKSDAKRQALKFIGINIG